MDGWMAEVSRLNQERANEREETVDGRPGGRKKRSAEGEKDRKREGEREKSFCASPVPRGEGDVICRPNKMPRGDRKRERGRDRCDAAAMAAKAAGAAN